MFKRMEPIAEPLTTQNRKELIAMAMQGCGRIEKIQLARVALAKLESNDMAELVRDLDRAMWRELKP